MKVLHLAYSLGESSAGTRIAKSVSEIEHMFYICRKTNDQWVQERSIYKPIGFILGIILHIFEKIGSKLLVIPKDEVFSLSISHKFQAKIVNHIIKKYDIDLLHVHWGGYSFFPVKTIDRISIPVLITTHDYQYFTGGCHIPMDCAGYNNDCAQCPLVKHNKMVKYFRKRNEEALLNNRDKVLVVTPSEFSKDYIKENYSYLDFRVIGNPIPNQYHGIDIAGSLNKYKNICIEGWYTIVIVNIFKSKRDNKGYETINKLLERLENSRLNIKMIAVSGDRFDSRYENVTYMPQLDSKSLIEVYQSADLCLVPSKYETFSQVTLESISTGTPVVAFDKTGPVDIIEDGKNGLLIPSFDDEKFIDSVLNYIDKKRSYTNLNFESHEKTRMKFSEKNIGIQYKSIYEDLNGK